MDGVIRSYGKTISMRRAGPVVGLTPSRERSSGGGAGDDGAGEGGEPGGGAAAGGAVTERVVERTRGSVVHLPLSQ